MIGSAMLLLCESLDSIDYRYTVYMDNAFATVPLLRMLRDRPIFFFCLFILAYSLSR